MTIDVEQTPLEDTINASNFAKQSEGSKEFSLDNTLQYTSNLQQSGSAPADSINIAAEQTPLEEAAVTSFLAKEKPQGNSSYDSPMKDSVNQTRSVSLTEVAAMCNDDDSSMDEVGSHSSLVTIGGYKIKQASVPLLEAIFQNYGDIAANCTLVSTQGRSRFLEDVCEIVKTLQDPNFLKITQEEIQSKFDYVCDLLNLNIQVWWLQKRLADILEAKQFVKQSSTLKWEKDKQMEMISEKERELKLYEEKISMIKEELAAANAKADGINDRYCLAKRKVIMIYESLLVDGLV
ncbi:uncharacterized protein LOC133781228 [Humulus lupulus]|uniref:uncharacterized protein LOC133781228 n=1 Tax=Humulus lupulus TaxID=3486 RepID=UPI002B403CD2|nr:uncharacterized protein LOC133781228 [Humulus lupulus]